MSREPLWLFPPVPETESERRVVLDGWIRRAVADTEEQQAEQGDT